MCTKGKARKRLSPAGRVAKHHTCTTSDLVTFFASLPPTAVNPFPTLDDEAAKLPATTLPPVCNLVDRSVASNPSLVGSSLPSSATRTVIFRTASCLAEFA